MKRWWLRLFGRPMECMACEGEVRWWKFHQVDRVQKHPGFTILRHRHPCPNCGANFWRDHS